MRDKEKALETIKDIDLTEEEKKSFEWLLGWEKSTVENICSIIEKAKGTQSKNQELMIDWIKSAILELEKLKEDRSVRILQDGGKAIIKENRRS